jgi:excisionase family DNA binding protein
MMSSLDAQALLKRKEAAAYLGGIAEQTLAVWASTGRGPAFVKIGRLVRYRRSDLDEWLREHTVVHHKRDRT